uniref:Reverse transcriptase Ty1/copia-type domain-containing protein n=1 Tax=Cajanus cajan TaxID=3821 RepID=A0A151SZJ2_CAJCA|nr:hypothetical protein KK1_015682 [Cajanus cajan]
MASNNHFLTILVPCSFGLCRRPHHFLNDHAVINLFKDYFHTCFHIKDLEKLKYFLGVEVTHSSSENFLYQ